MKKTICDLWYGNIYPYEQQRMLSSEAKALNRKYLELREQLEGSVSKDVFAKLQELMDYSSQISSYFEVQAFTQGFSLGARIVSEALSDDED